MIRSRDYGTPAGRIVLSLVLCVFGSLVVSVGAVSAATWSIQTTPNSTEAEHSALYDISCEAEALKACYSVGKQTTSGGVSSPYAQSWNGSSWANKALTSPAGATAAELQSIDCISGTLCYAGGSYTTVSGTFSLVENVGTEAIITTPNPAGASETRLKGIGCFAAIQCTAVGYSVEGTKKFAISMRNVLSFSLKTVPVPAGAKSSELHGVECPSSSFCMAVGSYVDSEGVEWAMAVSYNGTEWSLVTVPKPSGSKRSVLLDISCATTSECTAVGAYRNSSNVQVTFVERWNGTSWSYQASPNPTGSTNTVFQNVSCTEGATCEAVGDWNNGKVWQPMAQEWNGSAWALDTTPTPAEAAFSLLEGVACRVESCLASGWYIDSKGKEKTLGETR